MWSRLLPAARSPSSPGVEPGQQEAGLELGAGDAELQARPAQRRRRRPGEQRPLPARLDAGPHLAQGLHDAPHRPAAQGGVAVEDGEEGLPGQDSAQQARRRSGVAGVQDVRRLRESAGAGPLHQQDGPARSSSPLCGWRRRSSPVAPSGQRRRTVAPRTLGMQAGSERQSAPSPALVTVAAPLAMAFSITARWVMLLSPGTSTSPCRAGARARRGCSTAGSRRSSHAATSASGTRRPTVAATRRIESMQARSSRW